MKMAREQPATGDPKAPEDLTGPPSDEVSVRLEVGPAGAVG